MKISNFFYIARTFNKFCLVAATENKSTEVTAAQLRKWFCIIGAPVILQSDNGREFVNTIVEEMLQKFNIKILHGKPRHSQSQGSVERGNEDFEDIIFTWQKTNNSSQLVVGHPWKILKLIH